MSSRTDAPIGHDIEATVAQTRPVRIDCPLLIVLQSPVASTIGTMIPIEGTVAIGRSLEAGVYINDPALSRFHVELSRADGACQLRDLGSRNGTEVNGIEVTTIPLWPGDQIHIGATVLQFQDGSGDNGQIWVRRALTSSVVALWEHVTETDELVFSEHVDTALGLPPASLARRRLQVGACVHPEDRARLQAAFVAARDGAPLEIELRLQASPALERWVIMRGHRTEAGGHSVAGTMVDVTALKRREATLTHTALMFESFLDGVVLTDQGGRIVDLNSAMARLFGLVRTAAVGKSLFPAVSLDDPDRQLSDAYEAMAATGRWTTTLEHGPNACFEVLAFPLRTDHGESIGAIWMFRDVSEKQRMAAQIVFLDRLASLGTLSAGIAHEINNPLMFILGNAEFVRDGLASPDCESAMRALDDIIEGAQRISSIVRDLKMFSQANPDAKTQAIDVRRAIDMATKMAGGVVRAHAHLVVEIGPISHAAASESRLVQVLVNLLMNAAQSIPDDRGGATVTIRARPELDGVTIEISDTGKGMTPEILARAFEPFFTTKPLVGTGLGLSICHGLVTAMGGTIALRSAEGQGTTASIWLRAADNPRAVAPPAEAVLAHRRLRVLVIDDEPVLLRTAVRVLADHEVVVADGYATAIERLRQRAEVFDVILCDLMMPDGTGMDLHAWLVAERPELVARVVFVTGGAFTERAREFLHTTDNHTLQKPVDHATLRRAVLEAGRRLTSVSSSQLEAAT